MKTKTEPIIEFLQSEKKIKEKEIPELKKTMEKKTIINQKEKDLLMLELEILDKKIELEKLRLIGKKEILFPEYFNNPEKLENHFQNKALPPIYVSPDIQSEKMPELPPIQPPPVQSIQKKGFFNSKKSNNEMKRCPQCNSKLTKGKVINDNDSMKQLIKCRNPNCSYLKEYVFENGRI